MPTLSRSRRLLSWRSLLRIAALLLAVYALVVGILLAYEDRIVFHPVPATRRWNEPPADFVCHDVELRTADGMLIHGRWFPCPAATGAVLICHSQTGNVSVACGARELSGWHREIGVSVLIFDYPGYGQALFAAAHEPKRFITVAGGRHGGGLLADFFPALREFLARTSTPGPVASP